MSLAAHSGPAAPAWKTAKSWGLFTRFQKGAAVQPGAPASMSSLNLVTSVSAAAGAAMRAVNVKTATIAKRRFTSNLRALAWAAPAVGSGA